MASTEAYLCKMREERLAREKARIVKLRELNLKKYSKNESEPDPRHLVSSITFANKKPDVTTKANLSSKFKNNFHVNGTTKRPITAPVTNFKSVPNKDASNVKPRPWTNNTKISTVNKNDNKGTSPAKVEAKPASPIKIDKNIASITIADSKIGAVSKVGSKIAVDTKIERSSTNNTMKFVTNSSTHSKPNGNVGKNLPNEKCKIGTTFSNAKHDPKTSRKGFVPRTDYPKVTNQKSNPTSDTRKSMNPKQVQSTSKMNPNRQSVFERLYQPKIVHKKDTKDVQKLQTDPGYLKKVIKDSGLILNKRHPLFEPTKVVAMPVRRSISAVHFKRISKNEINNCIHKWASIGEKLDKIQLAEVDEDALVKEEKIVSAIKSERKKVKFQTPVPYNFNTPKPEELQMRLQNWLQKRGKSIDSYHHLQCFGIHHLTQKIKPLNLDSEQFDDENKENVPLDSDSDNDSYHENMNELSLPGKDKWRRVSSVSNSVDFNETQDSTMTSTEAVAVHQPDELLLGALTDLTELLREGFDWEQCARWLRAIRERFPLASESAAYWECRAALEERRGDLPASVHCWEEAVAKGTERSVVEANLDHLLDKFMQLKISPNSGKEKQPNPKLVDVKNVFKSTVIRFAVQQAKLLQSNQFEPPKYTVTPVRRSTRISAHWSDKRTPLRVYTSVKQAGLLGHPIEFVPNNKLCGTP